MLRSEYSIRCDLNKATKRKKDFYRQSLLAVQLYTEQGIKREKSEVQKHIKIFVERRKKYPDEYQYKPELKALRQKLRWIKYILNEGKKTSKKTTSRN